MENVRCVTQAIPNKRIYDQSGKQTNHTREKERERLMAITALSQLIIITNYILGGKT